MNHPRGSEYKHLTEHARVLKTPDIYIGSSVRAQREVLSFHDGNIQKITTDMAEGLEHLFIEVIGNAADNIKRSRENGIDPEKIIVNINPLGIQVTNFGRHIPIELTKELGDREVYIPELIFGNMGTSSNYDNTKEKTFIGKNGVGAKTANIFSKRFSVKVHDPTKKVIYTQTWENNMLTKHNPTITPEPRIAKGMVQIQYFPDFKRFQAKCFTHEDFGIFGALCAMVSFTCNIPVKFIMTFAKDKVETHTFHYKSIKDYSNALFDSKTNKLFHEEDNYSLCIADTPFEARHISFVNGMYTKYGGVHLDAVFACALNIYKEQDLGVRLTKNDIMNHISVIISCHVGKATFDAQTKGRLRSPAFTVNIPPQKLGKIKKWDIYKEISKSINKKQIAKLKKATDGKFTKSRILDPNIIDANFAGKKSDQCVLLLTEGRSAAQYAEKFISFFKVGKKFVGRDTFGIVPLKGVPLNTLNAKFQRLLNNKEFANIKRFMGLKDDVDYNIVNNRRKLRYQQIWLMVDADNDGKHIAGLLLLFFMQRFPGLVQSGCISLFRTPIVRCKKGRQEVKFFTEGAFNAWEKENNPKGWDYKYYKGLASSKNADIRDDFKNPRVIRFIPDENTLVTLEKVFHKDNAAERKKWLADFVEDYVKAKEIENTPMIKISDFIDYEMIGHSMAANIRCIPQIDGFKEALRKVFYCSRKDFFTAKKKEIKVEQAGAIACNKCKYKYGPNSLYEAIASSSMNFIGANNEPLFEPEGIIGTRDTGRNESAARYVSISESWWTSRLYKKEDEKVMKYAVEEGDQIEFRCYYPILPSILFNITSGIGTAYSTDIPSFFSLQIAEWYLARMELEQYDEAKLPELVPWFRGHTGVIRRRKDGKGFISEGRYQVLANGDIRIDELPVRLWDKKYRETFLIPAEENGLITEYADNTGDEKIEFTLRGWKRETEVNLKTLKLIKSFSFTNIVIMEYVGDVLVPRPFRSVNELCEYYYRIRYKKYVERKNVILTEMKNTILQWSERYKYIKLVIDGKLRVMKTPKQEVIDQMKAFDFKSFDHIKKVTTYMLTLEELNRLAEQIKKMKEDFNKLLHTTPKEIWRSEINEYVIEYKKRNPHLANFMPQYAEAIEDSDIPEERLGELQSQDDEESLREQEVCDSPFSLREQ